MNANASAAPKVLPIAKIPIKKTGMLITRAEATGKSAAAESLAKPGQRRSVSQREE
jgi:hypothetical protein